MGERGEITRIERQKSGAPRYNIHIDGSYRFAVHEDVLVKFALSKGMQVDAKEMERILVEEERNKVRQAVLRYVGYKPRTVSEVERYLTGKGFAPEHHHPVIAEMKKQGYLDDRRFAESWVEERRRTKGYGVAMLRQELKQKGISEEVVAEAVGDLGQDEEREVAQQVAEKRYRRLRGHPWPAVERRLGQYLFRRGFASSLVYSLLREYRDRHGEERE
ncbi:RecX family transcriptional regulator [Salinithrix halophila]|uniref:Regulatory protein RecX n=1 Tax=Salinithrix halophila TaxID=1485204 RepID=A0ABV8JHB8_9BACL